MQESCPVIRLEYVHEVDCRFGGADIVVVSASGLPSASGAFEPVVAGVYPSESQFSFEVPVLSEQPAISVCHTQASGPSLIAVGLEVGEVRSEKVETGVEMAYVVLSGQRVQSKEMSSQRLAEPVSDFRLHKPVLPFPVTGHVPCVELSGDIQ